MITVKNRQLIFSKSTVTFHHHFRMIIVVVVKDNEPVCYCYSYTNLGTDAKHNMLTFQMYYCRSTSADSYIDGTFRVIRI